MGSDVSRPQQSSGTGGIIKRGGSKKMSRRLSMGPPPPPMKKGDGGGTRTPSIRVGGSTGGLSMEMADNECDVIQCQSSQSSRLSLSIDQLNTPRSRSGSSSSQSPTKQPIKHRCSLSIKNRQLIQGCFNNPHENIGNRILKRAAERRKDFGRFYMAVTLEQREQIADTIKQFLKKSVACIDSADDELLSMAVEFGQRFVEYRLYGFKADYFAALADSTITECVLLDAAVHPAAVTLNAFSQFITMLFSSVRDGFYTEMRRLRRISNSFSTISNGSVSRKKLSVEDALKSIERSPPSSAAWASGATTGKLGSPNAGGEIRRGSTGTVENTSPRSLSPAENGLIGGKMTQSKSASPFSGSSQEEEIYEPNNNCNATTKKSNKMTNKVRTSKSPSPIRKISPGSNTSKNSQKAKDELKKITAEFLSSSGAGRGTKNFAKEGSNGPEEKARIATAVAH